MENIAINVDHVTKIYKLYDKPTDRLKESLGLTRKKLSKDHYALNDVSIQVKRGETVGIIGTNGSGKSTILKIITGVLNPTMGEVSIDGRISALLELGAGFNMEYTGIENIYLQGTMAGYTKEEVDQKMQQILDFADIGEFVHQPCKTYSSGMFVRLAFAVAINIEPEILIVDEALSVGDVFFQNKCYHKFEEFKKNGKTILMVSHDLSCISKYCDRVVLLNKGVKLAEGQPKEMIDIYKKLMVNQYDENDAEKEDVVTADNNAENTKAKLTLNPHMVEYGNGMATIEDFAIMDENGLVTASVAKDTEFRIQMKVRFHQKIEDPIFAYTIKNIKGEELTGTNSMLENIKTGQTADGDVYQITFTQTMMLQGGEYLLSFGCTGYHDGEFTVYHRLYDACNLTVVSERNTVGIFDMGAEAELTVQKA